MAVTPRKSRSVFYRSAVRRGLVAAVLTAAMAGLSFAQTVPPPTAGAPSPAAATAPAVAPQTPEQAATPAASIPSAGLVLPPQPPPSGPLSPPTEKRGFLNDFGNWWTKSVADFKTQMKEQKSKLDDFNKQSAEATQEAMKNAANAMVRLPSSRIVEIQQVCPTAGNGAPDCATAATNVCKGKGFSTGQPLDIRTAEKCAASLWMSGQAPTTADCPVETVLLRVACQ